MSDVLCAQCGRTYHGGNICRHCGHDQRKAARRVPRSQGDPIDRLAVRIAEENDRKARKRLDEMFYPQKYWTKEQKGKNNRAIILLLSLFVGIVILALVCAEYIH